uniref:Uncharacterized protein n=1 Tax=Rhizophora mucronata TaxID=61149 RepID=A0A2P2N8F2_RHIMU
MGFGFHNYNLPFSFLDCSRSFVVGNIQLLIYSQLFKLR